MLQHEFGVLMIIILWRARNKQFLFTWSRSCRS
jgi:hypothetical protein